MKTKRDGVGVKYITDVQVLLAARNIPGNREDGVSCLERLMKITGQPIKVCIRAVERAIARQLCEQGPSIRNWWAEPKGIELLQNA